MLLTSQIVHKFYEQTNGAPMGSPLSPVMANLFMEEFEKKALYSYCNVETWFLVQIRG
jgi:hypothetical protein